MKPLIRTPFRPTLLNAGNPSSSPMDLQKGRCLPRASLLAAAPTASPGLAVGACPCTRKGGRGASAGRRPPSPVVTGALRDLPSAALIVSKRAPDPSPSGGPLPASDRWCAGAAMTGFRKPAKNGWNPSSKMRDGELAPFETALRTPYVAEACHLSEADGWGFCALFSWR